MIEILGFDPIRDLAWHHWAAIGAGALALLLGVLRWLKSRYFPKRSLPGQSPRSLANVVTRASAVMVLVIAGEGIFEVISRAAPHLWWFPWLGVGLLELPLLAFALRAGELIAAGRREEAAQAIRLTWLFASLSAVISSSGALDAGDLSVALMRAAAPIMGVILWHHALHIELTKDGDHKRTSRWKWTPDLILTRLGLRTADATETADAEIHQRLTRVADWVIRYARAVQRNTRRGGWWNDKWNGCTRLRMERLYRAAERDLDLTRNTSRRALLEQIIASRARAARLAVLAGATLSELGVPEMEHPGRNKRIVFQPKVEHLRWNTRIVVRKVPVERPDRNAPDNGGTPDRNGRNSNGGTGDRNGRNGRNGSTGTPNRNTDQKPTREEIFERIRAVIGPDGKIPIRPLASELGIPQSTLHRHADAFRKKHGVPKPPAVPAQGNGHHTPDDTSEPLQPATATSPN
ncbi:hypothetical protein ACGFJC_47345 [Nonomuraea fuscirosea]|uniref:hypothetical protein n=1 Tax=Nonomuraea fuscirosea TaxID=1291556 RepID=UPI00371B1933